MGISLSPKRGSDCLKTPVPGAPRRKFVVNHPLTILRGTVAALFSHSYGSPLGIAAVLPDARGSRGQRV